MGSSDVMAYGMNLREEMLNRVSKHREAKLLWRYPSEKPSAKATDDKLFVIVVKRSDETTFQVGAFLIDCDECKFGWHWTDGDNFYSVDMLKAWAEVPEFKGFEE